MKTNLETRIISSPKIRGGKPCIQGHRIAIHDLAIWHEYHGMSVDEIATSYDLQLSDIYIGLGYYFANKAQIDAEIRKNQEEIEQLRKKHISILDEKLNAATH